MTSMAAIAGGLIIALTTEFRAAKIQMNDQKAFWLAEAGMADAVKRLKNDEINLNDGATDNSTMANVSFAEGTYSVVLTRTGNDISTVVTGTFGGQSRVLNTTFTFSYGLPPAFSYALFGGNTNAQTFKVGNNNTAMALISGDLFYNATAGVDIVDVKNSAQVTNGVVYADQATGGGSYTLVTTVPSPLPTYPSFTSTFYDNKITTAEANSSGNFTLSSNNNLNLAGGTVYYDTVTIKNTATVTGPGTIVATKAITIQDQAAIGADVNIITKKDVTIQDSATVQSGGSIYARTDITVKNSANVTSSLLAPDSGQQITVSQTAQVSGILYTDKAVLKDDTVTQGSVVANKFGSNQIEGNAHLIFNSNVLPHTLPQGITGIEQYTQKANSWNES